MALFGRIISNTRYNIYIDEFCKITCGFHTTSSKHLNQDWRRRRNLPENPNAFGPLTNLPDYSFADGRPAPFGKRLFTRMNKQKEILKKARELIGEVDYAVERYNRIQEDKKNERIKILESKFKPKGIKHCS